MTDETEAVALALLAIEDSWNDHEWEQLPEGVQALFRSQALSAITALDKHRIERAGEVERKIGERLRRASQNDRAYERPIEWKEADTLIATIASLRAELARAEERGVRMGIEAAADHLAGLAKQTPLGHENPQRGTSTYNWLRHTEGLVRNLDPAAIIRANALSELAAADAVLLDLPDTLADSDGDDGV